MNVGSQNALNEGALGHSTNVLYEGPKALGNGLNEGAQGTHSHFTKYGGQNVIDEGLKRNMEL